MVKARKTSERDFAIGILSWADRYKQRRALSASQDIANDECAH